MCVCWGGCNANPLLLYITDTRGQPEEGRREGKKKRVTEESLSDRGHNLANIHIHNAYILETCTEF